MKKLLAILLALVMVLMTSTGALAAEGVGADDEFEDNSGSTAVNVEVNSSNLSVMVPLSMTVVAPVAGGDCTVPTTYSIKNNSSTPIKVTGIQVTDATGGLEFSNNAIPTTIGTTEANKVSIALTPVNDPATAAVQLSTTKIESGLGGFDTAAGATKNITIAARNGALSSAETSTTAFTITYTIAAGATTP